MNTKVFEKVVCPICGKVCSAINEWRHKKWHEEHPNDVPHKSMSVTHEGLNCQYCGKLCKSKNSLAQHEIRCKENPNRLEQSGCQKGHCNIPLEKRGYGKGLTMFEDSRRMNNALAIKNYYITHHSSFYGKRHKEETKQILKEKQLENNHEYKNRYLWSKKGHFDNMFFMSTYELAYYIYMKDLGHKIVRCQKRFIYYIENEKHYYTPDFILDNGQIIEIKGRENYKDKLKYESVPNIQVLHYKDIKHMINYCLKKYKVKKIKLLYDENRGLVN